MNWLLIKTAKEVIIRDVFTNNKNLIASIMNENSRDDFDNTS